MKTAREWFETLPEPYRTQALANTDERTLLDNYTSAAMAVEGAFLWEDSPQEHEYWEKLHGKLLSGEPLEPQPDLAQLVREYFEARDAEPSRLRGDAKRVFERKMHAERTLRKAVGLE